MFPSFGQAGSPRELPFPYKAPNLLSSPSGIRVLSPLPQIPMLTCPLSKSLHSMKRNNLFPPSQVQGSVREALGLSLLGGHLAEEAPLAI